MGDLVPLNLALRVLRYLAGPKSQGASGTIFVKYLANKEVLLTTRLPAGSLLKLRLPKKNAWKAINYTFHVSAELARFVTGLVASSATG